MLTNSVVPMRSLARSRPSRCIQGWLLVQSYHKLSAIYRPVNVIPMKITKSETGENADSLSKSLRLLVDNGFIRASNVSGSFHFLPLGHRSLTKLIRLIDTHLDTAGCQKIQSPILTSASLWRKSGRLVEIGAEIMQLRDRHSKEIILGPTHEETICELISHQPISHKQLPLKLYQIGEKFRDEMRTRFGLLRSREFIMQDLYTFDCNAESATKTYEEICRTYDAIFKSVGIPFKKVHGTSGMMGGTQSHEYHLLSDVGEDVIAQCQECHQMYNEEVLRISDEKVAQESNCSKDTSTARKLKPLPEDHQSCPNCRSGTFSRERSIEVGHTFLLGNRYTEPFKSVYVSKTGKLEKLQMGCYGIGITRLLAAIIESTSVDSLSWPVEVAPYFATVILPKDGSREDSSSRDAARFIINALDGSLGSDLLVDDRTDQTIGKRLKDVKAIGVPYVVVLGKTIHEKCVELHDNMLGTVEKINIGDISQLIYDKNKAGRRI